MQGLLQQHKYDLFFVYQQRNGCGDKSGQNRREGRGKYGKASTPHLHMAPVYCYIMKPRYHELSCLGGVQLLEIPFELVG